MIEACLMLINYGSFEYVDIVVLLCDVSLVKETIDKDTLRFQR